jgi:osmotically inducible protein OsmC
MNATITRKADASWQGNVKDGHGVISTESRFLHEERYSLGCRFDDKSRKEVTPEELIAAAAASCFSMALSKTLTDREKPPTQLVTHAEVGMRMDGGSPRVDTLRLNAEGIVHGMSGDEFEDAVMATRETCPMYQLLEPGFSSVEVKAKLLPD